ncbi:Uncharacterised protein [Serratia marcescens]|nr:Uncharacterised protein [Serratia marcescens]CVB83181.1 Uncharacterised protein [Serratia marcescens]
MVRQKCSGIRRSYLVVGYSVIYDNYFQIQYHSLHKLAYSI